MRFDAPRVPPAPSCPGCRCSLRPKPTASRLRRLASMRWIWFVRRPQRLDVRDELPYLVLGDLRSPRRHALIAAFVDRAEHLRLGVAVAPHDVAQARAHAAAGAS